MGKRHVGWENLRNVERDLRHFLKLDEENRRLKAMVGLPPTPAQDYCRAQTLRWLELVDKDLYNIAQAVKAGEPLLEQWTLSAERELNKAQR